MSPLRSRIVSASEKIGRYSAINTKATKHSHENHDGRLDQRQSAPSSRVHIVFVELGHAVQHLPAARRWIRPLRSCRSKAPGKSSVTCSELRERLAFPHHLAGLVAAPSSAAACPANPRPYRAPAPAECRRSAACSARAKTAPPDTSARSRPAAGRAHPHAVDLLVARVGLRDQKRNATIAPPPARRSRPGCSCAPWCRSRSGSASAPAVAPACCCTAPRNSAPRR